ncbi:MAG TPA: DegV family protein [Candidatus Competibacteraceae bacterium]|nr:DegV family protein [Candidatus Competibacteraceae bacterium]
MKTGIVIDSACDLPSSYIQTHALHILPISLHFGSETFVDTRDAEATLAFYDKYITEKNLDAETRPFSVEQIRQLFLNQLVLKYDRVLALTIARTRSQIYENANEAAFAILNGYRERRQRAGLNGGFSLKVMDSQTLFTGQAVLTWEVVRLLRDNPDLPFSQLRAQVDALSQQVYAYLVPRDLFYLRNRASKRGDKSVGGLTYHLGTWLDIKPILQAHRGETGPIAKERGFGRALQHLFGRARSAIIAGLRTPVVAASYAGRLEELEAEPEFADFRCFAERHGVEVLLSIMSTTAGINVGPGAVALAYISR